MVVENSSAKNHKLGGSYMAKVRHIIVGLVSILYLILFIMKVEMPRSIFITLLTIVLINQLIDEWNSYKETKKKIHLLIPVTFIVMVIIFLISYVIFQMNIISTWRHSYIHKHNKISCYLQFY